ncbi:MAG: Ig-like domain-containing protein [Candidatus Neomarinimicrobiota bacterium]
MNSISIKTNGYNLYRMNTKIFLFYLLLTFIYSCASTKAPPGGPVDETPPAIIEVDPPSGTTGLTTNKISLVFSEYMDENSFKGNIKVFPQLSTTLEFKFKGEKIVLTLPDSLDSEKTYIIYLNRNIKDEHGISLAGTIQLAYTTGDQISSGIIEGKVYGEGDKSVHLWKFNETAIDSIYATPPDYITDVNDDGIYSFSYLAPGSYQVLSVDKSAAGLPLNTDHTGYGLYWEEKINLAADDTLSNINMRLWKIPNRLKLLRGEWSAFKWGRLIFNNDLPEGLIINYQLKYEDGIVTDSLLYYLDPIDQKNLIIQPSDSLMQKSIKVNIRSLIFDDEVLLDSSEVLIQIPQDPDTSYLQILKPVRNFQISPNRLTKSELNLIFSKPVQLSTDSLLNPKLFKYDSVQVKIKINQKSPMHLQLVPLLDWEENENYQLKIYREGVLSEYGRGLKDSVSIINLRTTKSIGFGMVTGNAREFALSNLAIELFSTKNPSLSQTTFVNFKSEYEFKTVPEGDYSLYFFEDGDNDMKYSFGNAYLNIPSEWFYFYPDTFEVRSNWETEIGLSKLTGIK